YPQADRERLCVTGGSYGGFMTNWIITHSRRFAAAVSQRGIANWITTELLCDNGWYNMPPQLMGDVSTGADKLWEQSPLKYVGSVKTPTLFLHADEDYSVPAEEGMQMFSALMAMGVETRMVRFKGENHELSRSGRPLARIRRLEEIIRWMEEHI
ncbi:MAG: prolyl oligopeptidase family serine peptidase, partial [Clostridium sp.]|nr:prolyl oligopeptidase family serine peptidase [Clostridium sp.]